MKKIQSTPARKRFRSQVKRATRTQTTRGTRFTPCKPSLLARPWAEVHPKPARPIGHPIPPLTPLPVPPPVKGRGSKFKGQYPDARRPAAVDYLSSLLCVGFMFTLLVTGCASTRPLKGGKAVTTRTPAGIVQQTLVQGENASQPTKQDQETVKIRTYTVPAGSRILQPQMPIAAAAQPPSVPHDSRPSTLDPQPPPAFIVSAPMPVIEREETRAKSELGAAQKDTARELGARLSSHKGIIWVGAGLFVFGLASLVWPPLKAVIASVTTSAALMLGGVALMVLPTLVVGNELLILAGVVLAVGAWFLAHRHGQLRGVVAASVAPQPAPPNS
jgi:hypothetical protein